MENKSMIRRFSVADFEEEQEFLSLQHSLGWKLKSIRRGLYTFEKSAAEKIVYQLDYNPMDKDEDEYIQMFMDYGWEFIQKYKSRYYFRKTESETECKNNIFSDTESKAEMCKKLINRRLLLLIPLTIVIAILNVLFYSSILVPVYPFPIILSKVILGIMAFAMTIVFYVSYFSAIFKLNRIIRNGENETLDESLIKKRGIPNTVLVLLSVFACIAAMLLNLNEFAFGHAMPFNMGITICFILFWAIFLFLARKERKLLTYAVIFWGLTFVSAILVILVNYTTLELNVLMLPVIVMIGPMFGVDIISVNNVFSLSVIALIAIVFMAFGIWLTIKSKQKSTD